LEILKTISTASKNNEALDIAIKALAKRRSARFACHDWRAPDYQLRMRRKKRKTDTMSGTMVSHETMTPRRFHVSEAPKIQNHTT
jgi:hypothetical protein